MVTASNWTVVTESRFADEREALKFVRQRFRDHRPYRAWTNFSFLADAKARRLKSLLDGQQRHASSADRGRGRRC
jgi:ferric-dicitrate binding protein FerR (iron transport regulator)